MATLKFFTFLFGDSSYIVHYLRWLGYHLSPVVQTGSNFGIEVVQCEPVPMALWAAARWSPTG